MSRRQFLAAAGAGGALLRTLPNIQQAISCAAYRAASDLFPGSISSVFDPLMRTLGYDPGDLSTDTSTPSGVGNVAARAVLDFRHTGLAARPAA
jgi:hypothetical protein